MGVDLRSNLVALGLPPERRVEASSRSEQVEQPTPRKNASLDCLPLKS